MQSLRPGNCMGIPVGDNINNPNNNNQTNNQTNNNMNRLQQTTNLLNNEAVPSHRLGDGDIKVLPRNQRVFDDNDFNLLSNNQLIISI